MIRLSSRLRGTLCLRRSQQSIERAISDEVRSFNGSVKAELREGLSNAITRAKERNGRTPSIGEVARSLGVVPERIQEWGGPHS